MRNYWTSRRAAPAGAALLGLLVAFPTSTNLARAQATPAAGTGATPRGQGPGHHGDPVPDLGPQARRRLRGLRDPRPHGHPRPPGPIR